MAIKRTTATADLRANLGKARARPWRERDRGWGGIAAVPAFCLLVIAGLWISLAAWSHFDRQETLDNAVHRNENLAVALEHYTVQAIQSADAVLQAVRVEYLRAGGGIDLFKLVADLEISKTQYLGIGVIDEHGDLLATTMTPGPAKANFSDREHFTVHIPRDTGRALIGKPVASRLLGKMTIPITRRINKPDGSFGGVVVVQIEPARFTELYKQATLGSQDVVSIIGLDGITRARRVGNRESSGEDIGAGKLFAELAQRPTGNYTAPGALDGVSRLFSFRTLPDFPLVVTTGEAESAVLAEFHGRRSQANMIGMAITLFVALIGVLLTLTLARQKRALETIADNEERLRAAFEQAAVGLAHTAQNGRLLRVNRKFCEIVGYSMPELLTLRFLDITHPDDIADSRQHVNELLQPGKTARAREKRYLRKDGSTVWVSLSAAAVRDELGNIKHFAATIQDISIRKAQETSLQALARQLEAQSRIFSTALSSTSDFSYILDRDGRFVFANQALLDLWGLALDEVVGRDFFELRYPEEQAERLHRQVLQVVETRQPIKDDMHYVDGAGVGRDYEYILNPVIAADGSVDVVSGSTRDVTDRLRGEQVLRLQADLLAAVGQAVIASDLDGVVQYANPSAERLYGWTAAEMSGRRITDITPTETSPEQADAIMARLREGESWSGEIQVRHRDGSSFPAQVTDSPIFDKHGALVGVIGVSSDISERKSYQKHVEFLATHDALTDLPNRNLLDDRLTQAMARCRRDGTGLAVVFLDVDHFKYVNDGYGHPVGDAVLRGVAARLRGLLRSTDTVARFGGDEFVLLLTDLADPLPNAAAVGRSLVESFAQPFTIESREFNVTASIGISIYPADGQALDELLTNADAALYRAKELGRNNFQMYAGEMSAKARARISLERALRHAVALGQLELHYQPLVAIATGEVIGMEALVRWRHPDLGEVAPADFIPLAEEIGLIVPIGEWVLRTACAQSKAWQAAGMPAIPVAVNVSAVQFRQPGFVDLVADVLRSTTLEPRHLNLEVTESMVMGKDGAMIDCLNQLRDLGVALSMDDFGTGYSNLGYLAHLPLDTLKIDRSFVRGLPGHKGAESIARAIVSMARSLGMRVVAEGIETVEQANFLESIWCEHAQGYFYCRPLPADDFAAWMRTRIDTSGTHAVASLAIARSRLRWHGSAPTPRVALVPPAAAPAREMRSLAAPSLAVRGKQGTANLAQLSVAETDAGRVPN